MKKLLLGVDLGTTQVKAVLCDEEGKVLLKKETGHYSIVSEHSNWAEQDADIWWDDTSFVIRSVIEESGREPGDIIGVSVSSQGMAMLPVNEKGHPLMRALIWMDRRPVQEAHEIGERLGRRWIKEHLGAEIDPFYQLCKIYWLKKHLPEIYRKTAHIIKANTYLNYCLTGKMAIDETQAIMSLCYDCTEQCWSERVAAELDLPLESLLPPVKQSTDILGLVTEEASLKTGLVPGTPVLVGGVDSALALLEVGLSHVGDAVEITGTSSNAFYVSNTRPPVDSPLSWIMPIVSTPEAPELIFAPTNTTGESLRWVRSILGLTESIAEDGTDMYAYIDRQVTAAKPGQVLFYPYLSGERAPLWDNNVSGMFIGMNLGTSKWDLIRSVYEGTSFVQKELLIEAEKTGISVDRFRITGGCARSLAWLKIKASILNRTLEVVEDGGGAAKGDAILVGHALGLYPDLYQTVSEMVQIRCRVEPEKDLTAHYEELYKIFIETRAHVYQDLHTLSEIKREY